MCRLVLRRVTAYGKLNHDGNMSDSDTTRYLPTAAAPFADQHSRVAALTSQMEEAVFCSKAWVMVRDEQTGMWRQYKEDSLSNVTITHELSNNSHHIKAERISDRKRLIQCVIQSDLTYQKIYPGLIHHWSVNNSEYRLLFQTKTQATKFENAVRKIVDDITQRLLQGSSVEQEDEDDDDQVFIVSAPASNYNLDPSPPVGDRNQTSNSSTVEEQTVPESHLIPPRRPDKPFSLLDKREKDPSPELPPRTIVSRSRDSLPSKPAILRKAPLSRTPGISQNQQQQSIVHLTHGSSTLQQRYKVQSGTYDTDDYGAVWEGIAAPPLIPREYGDYRKDFHQPPSAASALSHSAAINNDNSSESSLSSTLDDKKDYNFSHHSNSDIPPLPIKLKRSRLCCCFKSSSKKGGNTRGAQLQCKECHHTYYEKENRPGSCSGQVTFSDKLVSCCTCDSLFSSCLQRSRGNNCKRKTLKILLGLIWPCIWCYEPCNNCQGTAKQRGCVGACHIPMQAINKSSSQSASRL